MKTEFHTITEILEKDLEPPLPLEIMPNHMGINLCAVDGMSWTRQKDGQLVSVTVHFIPDNDSDHVVTDSHVRIPDETIDVRDEPSVPPAPPRRKSFLERIASATIDWLDDVAEERDAKRSRGST